MEVIKTNESTPLLSGMASSMPCQLCGMTKICEDPAPKYMQFSKFILISMIKKKGLALKYGFTRSKPDLVDILVRLDNGVDHQVILQEQRNALCNG